LSTLQDKYEAIDDRYRTPSKARDAARYIVRMDHTITTEERKAIIAEIPINRKTLEGVLTELRKLNLYPPQKTAEDPKRAPVLEKPQESSHHSIENPPPPLQEYAMREDFETLRNSTTENFELLKESVNNLASLMNEELPAILGGEPPSNPEIGIADRDNIVEVIDPSMDLERENPLVTMVDSVIELEGNIISRKSVGFTSKSLLLFDLVRKKGFRGNFADFVNSCITSALKGRKFKLVVEEEVE